MNKLTMLIPHSQSVGMAQEIKCIKKKTSRRKNDANEGSRKMKRVK
jgi:hypothetical protein